MPRRNYPDPPKGTGTAIYGVSDDLIGFAGDVRGEVGGGDDAALVICSDGTLLTVRYGKPGLNGIWGITLLKQGDLFRQVVPCTDEDADVYSDVAWFDAGLKWAYAAREWQKVK